MKPVKSSLRVGVFFEHYGPYHVARIKAASKHVDVLPIEVFGECETYAWQHLTGSLNIEREVLFPNRFPGSVSRQAITQRLNESLDRLSLDVLAIHGWSLPGAISSFKWARQNNIPAIVMSESKQDDQPRSLPKEKIKQSILAHASAGLVGAESHREYLVHLGLPSESVFFGYDAVDNDYFLKGSSRSRTCDSALRSELNLPPRYFFASSRFVEKKNLRRLIEAFRKYTESTVDPWSLVVAGEGPLRDELTQLVADHELQEKVHFVGFLQYEVLPVYYGLASAFVHVSTTEQWGLVVNEAAASGLPLVVSRSCGCAPHLLRDGENGIDCDAFDVASITSALVKISQISAAEREAMSDRSLNIVANFGPDQFGNGLKSAAEHSLIYPRAGSAIDRVVMSLVR